MFFKFNHLYKINKSRRILKHANNWYKKHWKTLPKEQLDSFEEMLSQLDQSVLAEDRIKSDSWARKVELFCKEHCKRSPLHYFSELFIALLCALIIATVVRQMWFELYEIPTGSMRPTFKEKDRLIVTKTSFGINIPLKSGHFYFDPDLVQRTGVVIWSGDKIDLPDTQSYYFDIIPYTKRFIKRLIGKPGDSLYFYGGKIYGVDKEGKPINELLDSPWMNSLEHIPFIRFDGRIKVEDSGKNSNQVVIRHMNQPLGKVLVHRDSTHSSEVNVKGKWEQEAIPGAKGVHFNDYFGIGNFAMARLLTKEQMARIPYFDSTFVNEGTLYLQLSHSPSLGGAPRGNRIPLLSVFETVIPLKEEHLKTLWNNLYTARFVVKNGRAQRYSVEGQGLSEWVPFSGIPDGTYEFYHGKPSQVGWGGILTSLPDGHPLLLFTPERLQQLFNMGIDFKSILVPYTTESNEYPSRYAYFKEGDLYLLGVPVIKKDESTLIDFNKREKEREDSSTRFRPYVAFKDQGPPLKNGQFDIEKIRTYGLTIPEKNYFVLGDNHAMSSDSRFFGFVPEDNLEGTPSLILWPLQERMGTPAQKPNHWLSVPNVIAWGLILLISLLAYTYYRTQRKKPIYHKLSN